MSGRDESRADDVLRGVLRALGDDVRRDFSDSAAQHGPYRVLRLVGAGATSEVFAASREGDAEPTVRYAVKVVRPGADVREVLARFEREREVVARIAHPSIVPVIDSGITPDGRPWFAMPLVHGGPITAEADERKLGLEARVRLMRAVAETVGAAHAAGVVHRDLKPGNILVEERGGALVPRLIDFGIARAIAGDQARLTPNDHAHRLGTPDYMSPEQWKDGVGACDARSDVFALGVVFGELMAGVLPRGGSAPGTASASTPGSTRGNDRRAPAALRLPSQALAELSARDRAKADAAAARRGLPDSARLEALLREGIDALFMRATAQDRVQRFTDASAFAKEL